MEDLGPEQQQPRQLGQLLVVIAGLLVVFAAVVGIALLVTGGDDSSAEVGSGNVAKIETVGPITQREFDHWYANIARSRQISGDGSQVPLPQPDSPRGEAIKDETMRFLIDKDWVEGAAKEERVIVNNEEVRRSFAEEKRKSFGSEARYRQFLKQTGQTQLDVLERVHLNVTTIKLRAKLKRNFQDGQFEKKWRARTVCATDYLVPNCGNS